MIRTFVIRAELLSLLSASVQSDVIRLRADE